MKENILLIAGCSHAAGSEIDGTADSKYNRQHSFGNRLASNLRYTPINIASAGSCNSAILRSVLEWFSCEYDADKMNVAVLVAWTEPTRMEAYSDPDSYQYLDECSDWKSKTQNLFLRINLGYPGSNRNERRLLATYHTFIANNVVTMEMQSANYVLQLQYFLKLNNISYVMCNSTEMFSKHKALKWYMEQIDKTRYMDMFDTDNAFYNLYTKLGYVNPKAKYFHHNEIPHKLYAKKLFNFISDNNLF